MTNRAHISSAPVPTAPIPSSLDGLLRQRFHGAANVRGIRFQLLYFVWRVFDLYRVDGAPDVVVGEGLEDVDLKSVHSGNEYVQVKHLGRDFDWSKMRGVIASFRDVLTNDLTAQLTLVSNARFAGEAAILHKHLAYGSSTSIRSLPKNVREKLIQELQPAQSSHSRIVTQEEFLGCFRIERLTEEELMGRIYAAVVLHFGVTSGNEELYVLALFSELARRSGNRSAVSRRDVEAVRLYVEDHIARGTLNPAVRDGFIVPIQFTVDKPRQSSVQFQNLSNHRNASDDFFEGRAARPDHIASGLDVLRPTAIESIHATLDRVSVCVVVASSGQGKSTLAYRYAHDNYPSSTVFAVKVCRNEEDIGQIATYLHSRLRLGLPLLVVIDNLGYHVRLWYQLATEMANEPIAFLVTAREEDWFRYRGNTAGFTWSIVRPQLDFNDARQIYEELRKRDLIATGVLSAQWAFERVRDQRLLIEFVYLLTHGRMLADRLEDQLTTLRSSEEDPGKLEALRLISVAQRYGARITAKALVMHSGFRGDPQQALASLLGEYIVCVENGVECEGLHPVRSEHLIALLHNPLTVSHTIERIVTILDGTNLPAFTRNALADPQVAPNVVLSLLAERCASDPPTLFGTIIQACFDAEEQRYFERHRRLFDEAYKTGGDSRVAVLAMLVLPRGTVNLLEDLRQIDRTNSSLDHFDTLVNQFEPRTRGERLERLFLENALEKLDTVQFARDLSVFADLMYWCYDTGIDVTTVPAISEILSGSYWQDKIFDLPVDAAAVLSFAVSRVLPEKHRMWAQANRSRIVGFFKLGTFTSWFAHILSR